MSQRDLYQYLLRIFSGYHVVAQEGRELLAC
jgi:hypothetical protein